MNDTMQHLDEERLVLHYYGELDGTEETATAAHLTSCADCHREYTRLQRVLAAVNTLPSPVLPDGFERTVWARLEPALPRPRSWWSRMFVAPPNLAWAATVIVLIAGAFFAGRVTRPQDPRTPALTAEQIREGVLLTDLSEHLHRSQTMLVELVSAEDTGADTSGVDIRPERERAEELVAANRLYRQTASDSGDVAVGELLDDLERLLVELATRPDHLSPDEFERVRQQIAAKDLLFKLRVVSDGVRERQTQQIRARAGHGKHG
jgi:hypothetical protein